MCVMLRIRAENVPGLLALKLGDHKPSAVGSRCSPSIGPLGFLVSQKSKVDSSKSSERGAVVTRATVTLDFWTNAAPLSSLVPSY